MIPTLSEMVAIKAFMCYSRNATLAGASIIARELTLRIWPELAAPRTTMIPC